jgi:hypothetical protein
MSTVLGLAKAIIKEHKAIILKTYKQGFSFVQKDSLFLKPAVELIFNVADCWLRFQKNHAIAIGIKRNSQKNSGFKKVILFISYSLF